MNGPILQTDYERYNVQKLNMKQNTTKSMCSNDRMSDGRDAEERRLFERSYSATFSLPKQK